ncbi:MAG: DUF4402 domain-containing protein [Proteobacteria bacterium]|nr:DUF4402 domain-containing protein [Pseudomonadota bacterium]
MNVRHTAIRVGAGLLIAALATSAFAAGSVQSTANATLTVLSPTTLTKTQDMAFGSVVRPTSGTNTVTLSTAGVVSISGGGNGSLVNSTTNQAKFVVTTAAADTFTTTQSLTFTQAGLLNISASAPTATSGTLGTITGANGGSQELNFGGQFDITSATTAQAYTGTLTVTVNYN